MSLLSVPHPQGRWLTDVRLVVLIRRVDRKALGKTFKGDAPLPGIVTFPAAVVLALWCAASALAVDALAGPLERVEFEGASQSLLRGTVVPGDRIQGYLARPDGAGPFPAVVGLHGCAGMHETAKQKLANDLVASGYVTLLVDSFATRGIDHLCSYSAVNISRRMSDAYGALAFLARQSADISADSNLQPL